MGQTTEYLDKHSFSTALLMIAAGAAVLERMGSLPSATDTRRWGGQKLSSARRTVTERRRQASERISLGTQKAREQVAKFKGDGRNQFSDTKVRAKDVAYEAGQQLKEQYTAHPVSLSLAAIGAGMLVGLTLPFILSERKLFGTMNGDEQRRSEDRMGSGASAAYGARSDSFSSGSR